MKLLNLFRIGGALAVVLILILVLVLILILVLIIISRIFHCLTRRSRNLIFWLSRLYWLCHLGRRKNKFGYFFYFSSHIRIGQAIITPLKMRLHKLNHSGRSQRLSLYLNIPCPDKPV